VLPGGPSSNFHQAKLLPASPAWSSFQPQSYCQRSANRRLSRGKIRKPVITSDLVWNSDTTIDLTLNNDSKVSPTHHNGVAGGLSEQLVSPTPRRIHSRFLFPHPRLTATERQSDSSIEKVTVITADSRTLVGTLVAADSNTNLVWLFRRTPFPSPAAPVPSAS
jgi:hypothetical protein